MKKMKFALGGNIDGKGENAGYQHFLLFPQCFFFQKASYAGSSNSLLHKRNVHFSKLNPLQNDKS